MPSFARSKDTNEYGLEIYKNGSRDTDHANEIVIYQRLANNWYSLAVRQTWWLQKKLNGPREVTMQLLSCEQIQIATILT